MILKLQRPRRLFCHLMMASLSLSCWFGCLLFTNHRTFHQQMTQRQKDNFFETYKGKQQDLLHLKETLLLYTQAKKRGLLARHDRQNLQKILEKLTKRTKLCALHFKISLTRRHLLSSSKLKRVFAYQDTPISLTFDHPQDVDIFKFMETLPDHLPGFLMPEQLTLLRSESTSHAQKNRIQGRYDFHLITWEETL